MRETPAFGRDNLLAVKLLLALCVRKGELFRAKWEEFDLEDRRKKDKSDPGPVWRLPAERTKTGSGLDIPLSLEVVQSLSALRTLAGTSEYLFPARRRDPRARQEHVGPDTLNAAMGRLKHKLKPFTLHDLRRTARTQLAELGIRSEVAERCLNHKLRGLEGRYNRHDYFNERREALAAWTALLVGLEAGHTKVVPIRAKAKRQ